MENDDELHIGQEDNDSIEKFVIDESDFSKTRKVTCLAMNQQKVHNIRSLKNRQNWQFRQILDFWVSLFLA